MGFILPKSGIYRWLAAKGWRIGSIWQKPEFKQELDTNMAKVNPGEFVRQVRAEGSKVVWPTRQETITTAIMVFIMMAILAVFFLGVDTVFGWVVEELISLA